VPAQQGAQRAQATVGTHRPVIVGDVIEHARTLPASDLGDRQPAQDTGADEIEVGAALAEGAQPRAFAAQVFRRNVLQRVGFGGSLYLARSLLGCAWVGAGPGLAQGFGGERACRRQG
jgi:hypothetical protein